MHLTFLNQAINIISHYCLSDRSIFVPHFEQARHLSRPISKKNFVSLCCSQQNLNDVNARTQLLSPFYGQASGHQGRTIECCFCNHNENRKFINNYRPLQGNCRLYYIGGTNAVEAGNQSNGKQK